MLLVWIALLGCKDTAPHFASGGSFSPHPEDTSASETTDDSEASTDDTGTSTDDSEASTDDTDNTDDTGTEGIPGGSTCGTGLNKIACNLTGTDQNGKRWELWDSYGSTVVMVVGHAYDGNFLEISGYLQGVADKRGAVAAVALLDTLIGTHAAQADASSWASSYGLSTVLFDADNSIRGTWIIGNTTTTYILDSDLKINAVVYGYLAEGQLDERLKKL